MNGLEKIKNSGIVAIIRGAKSDTILKIIQALREGGIDNIEITVEVPGAIEIIKEVNAQLRNEIYLGAGTVLDGETARLAILAGAQFIVSPSMHPDVITVSKRYGKIVIPGAMTPTEIVRAYELGADMVKVFPADVLGPQYIKEIRGPLSHIPIMVTGGIDLHNAADFIKAGATVIGIGGSLISQKISQDEESFKMITEKARNFVEEVKRARLER
ncbi:2-keto-3-deoxy-phosphogluconate aldolase [Caldanaerobius fijiensis DSM 17918]|uniref:2-keto-3-deoxy-phosphogluconate aldolase n=1 Tax=Caldanaerobius fijiensis DSM 17918 TaxID=1121256 RepID=A0A1M4W389_9THEO|nr:bifunctional 4-hydroxy-2-oxoglutarate aldolase/2-dehydro-3-deoxy-phosphogluconate aldolase [Caldanaerobius fijiensis]SHE75625.1 2-keto-3-deoxy-phosphogluconate aldolase [Caldanaerobius fijiensis DSM 17918]